MRVQIKCLQNIAYKCLQCVNLLTQKLRLCRQNELERSISLSFILYLLSKMKVVTTAYHFNCRLECRGHSLGPGRMDSLGMNDKYYLQYQVLQKIEMHRLVCILGYVIVLLYAFVERTKLLVCPLVMVSWLGLSTCRVLLPLVTISALWDEKSVVVILHFCLFACLFYMYYLFIFGLFILRQNYSLCNEIEKNQEDSKLIIYFQSILICLQIMFSNTNKYQYNSEVNKKWHVKSINCSA